MTSFSHFICDEAGAVTVDWVVLTAAVVGVGLASVGAVRTGVVSLGGDVETSLTGASVAVLGRLDGSPWEFTPLWIGNMEELHGPNGYIFHLSGRTPDQLRWSYDRWTSEAQNALNQGNIRFARERVDQSYAASYLLLSRGESLNATSVSLESLHNAVASAM